MNGAALVVLPTYNEAENIGRIIPAILGQGQHIDVLVVDDNSPDGTGRLVDELATAVPRIAILHGQRKQGLGPAYVAGFKWALQRSYEYVFEMDADFSHDPGDLLRLLAAARHADLVIGSRWVTGGGVSSWPAIRRVISQGGSLYARAVLGLPVRDLTSGFKCFRAATLRAIDLDAVRSSGYAFQVEVNYICHQLGFRLAEVPIVFTERRAGSSKMSGSIIVEAMLVAWHLRSERGRGSRVVHHVSSQ